MKKTDLSALRFNQVTVVVVTALAVVLRLPWLSVLLGLAMFVGALRPGLSPMRWLYRVVGQRLGMRPEVVDESPEAHLFLLASGLTGWAGLGILSAVLGVTVIALALLNLTAHICVGCLMYFQWKMLRYRISNRRLTN